METRLIIASLLASFEKEQRLALGGEDSLWSIFTALAASVSTVSEPNPPLPLLGKNPLINLLRVRPQPLEEHSQQNNSNQGKDKVSVRPDVPRLEHDAGIDYLSIPRSSWPFAQQAVSWRTYHNIHILHRASGASLMCIPWSWSMTRDIL